MIFKKECTKNNNQYIMNKYATTQKITFYKHM